MGIPDVASSCTIELAANPKELMDALTVLMHSVHIKGTENLRIDFLRFTSYLHLVPPLLRTLRLLRRLKSIDDICLIFRPEKGTRPIRNEKHFKSMVSAFEEILNESLLKSSRALRLLGSEGLLSQYYRFTGPQGIPSPSTNQVKRRLLSAKEFFARSQDKKLEGRNLQLVKDVVAEDDLQYTPTRLSAFNRTRVTFPCSPSALLQTEITLVNLGCLDFLRPPFSQWMFSMLRASSVRSMAVGFSYIPEDVDEVYFILKRLAAACQGLTKLYLYDIKEEFAKAIIEWVLMFPNISKLIVEPFVSYGNSKKPEAPLRHEIDITSPSHSIFLPSIQIIEGPREFLSWLIPLLRPDLDRNFTPSPSSDSCPPKHPNLWKVSIVYSASEKFDLSSIASAVVDIHPFLIASAVLPPPHSYSTGPKRLIKTAYSPGVLLRLQLSFEKDFSGLGASLCKGNGAVAKLVKQGMFNLPDIKTGAWLRSSKDSALGLEDIDAWFTEVISEELKEELLKDASGAQWIEARNMGVLSIVSAIHLDLPGTRREIEQGKFDDKIMGVISVFLGLDRLTLSTKQYADEGRALGQVSDFRLRKFQGRNPNLRIVEIS
ncbi:hypothetical protein D9611_000419 [Ephemerocybe angulata]|uniref:Uncharacterized protein n=1 Tax=Ephemerocybe angulata TaxID=980116 RepID=A0A8H5F7C2_9AGAR|nr:hypothetical protein D9611_000419 [Tulosesus angulatus]